MDHPNILYIHSHDTGRYIQPYGHAINTPNLQQLAEAGILFRQACCAAPTCSPSRAALLTGQSAHSSGMLGLAHRGFALRDPKEHLANTLREAGYRTVLTGVQHVTAPADAGTCGYDEIPASAGEAEVVACEFLRRAPRQPFFVDIGFRETHRVGDAFHREGARGDGRYSRPPAPLPDGPEVRRDFADFCVAAERLDAKIGSVLAALEEQGLAENTLVLYTTDHGIAFPGMKCSLTDHGIGVSLILRGPGGFRGGQVCDALVSHVDLYPTFCDLLGIARPAWLQGESLLPLVRGETEQVREELFAEVTFHAAFEPKRAARTRRWKYLRNFGDRRRPVLPNCDDSPSKDVWLAGGWREREVPPEQLYDLLFDPNESCDLAGDAAHAPILTEMRGRLDRWMRATGDPLLAETLPVPPGIRVNPADGLSPRDEPTPWTG
jgi:N-sulfoglucosamine sulfohydrolase